MMPQTKGVPALIEKIQGNIITLIYVGGGCLFHYPTNQDAWEHLKCLIAVGDNEDDWPQEVYMVLVLYDRVGPRPAQIGHITCPESNETLIYTELWGEDFDMFRQRVVSDWPKTKEALRASGILRV